MQSPSAAWAVGAGAEARTPVGYTARKRWRERGPGWEQERARDSHSRSRSYLRRGSMMLMVVGRRIAGLGVGRPGGKPLGCSLLRGGRQRLVGRVGGGGSWGSCIGCMGLES